MMLILGILILLGVIMDTAVNTWSGLNTLMILCGLTLMVLNIIGKRRAAEGTGPGKAAVKSLLSVGVLAVTALFLYGFFSPAGIFASGDEAGSIIKEARKIHESGNIEKALAYIEKETEGMEWDRDIALTSSELLEEAERYTEAKDKLDDIFYYLPLDLEARLRYAAVSLKEKNFQPALDQLLYITRADPSHADAYSLLGEAYWEMGDHIRGIFYHKLAVNEAPGSIEKRMKLALAYAGMHSYLEADLECKKALEMASSFEEELLVYNGYDTIAAEQNKDSQGK